MTDLENKDPGAANKLIESERNFELARKFMKEFTPALFNSWINTPNAIITIRPSDLINRETIFIKNCFSNEAQFEYLKILHENIQAYKEKIEMDAKEIDNKDNEE